MIVVVPLPGWQVKPPFEKTPPFTVNAPLPDLMKLIRKNFSKEQHNALPNGIFVLKGGDLTEEIKPFKKIAEVTSLDTYFDEEWFKEDKKLIYVPV